jgi:hypothetical protein
MAKNRNRLRTRPAVRVCAICSILSFVCRLSWPCQVVGGIHQHDVGERLWKVAELPLS